MARRDDRRWREAPRGPSRWSRPTLAAAALLGAAALVACDLDRARPEEAARVAATAPATVTFCALGDRHPAADRASVDGTPLGLTSADLAPLAGDVETATFAVG